MLTGTERKEMFVWIVVVEWEEWEFSVCGYWMLVTWWKCSVGGLISRSVSSSSCCCCKSSSSNCSSGGSKWYNYKHIEIEYMIWWISNFKF